ncbi:hydantoinase/oxoprolinase family protein [Nocardioides panzhihuensis]|uniref:N-methylhydantoinase A n=1 Tax=Nocardioides panzhihuensis TaxID=860243 RepID=A0A7Z0DS72_9ACTN|nr:hydantoinase/oxoprolinase family protein [Nocardioides panzhihuensis]NYI80401.1 N-methylhydantoinase A [Nocardioides panzhihuensis]
MAYVIGVDVGGTFTDAILDDGNGTVVAAKSPTTPPNYSQGVMDVIHQLAENLGEPVEVMLDKTHHIAHGTTSSLNALVMGTVPAVGFLTTAGHRDSIYIMNVEGRYLGSAPHELQSVMGQRKTHLIPKSQAYEVIERVDHAGNVVVKLNEDSVRESVAALLAKGIRSIAVSLLWSFRNPAHEQRVREIIQEIDPEVFVALSHEVSPRIREFSRSSTTIMSAQIGPGLRDYLGELESRLTASGLKGPLLVMQSNGGAIAASEAPATAISTIGSVLTGGVVGAVNLGQQLGHKNIISTDVGGTTFLVGLVVDGEPVRTSQTIINHHPINVPTLEVHAIGSGGGAVAWIDRGGNLQVGPRSAQSVPGPACYGAGGVEPTNTDANLVLGILPETGLVGGRKKLDVQAAREAIRTHIAEPLGISVENAAAAIYAIQNAQTGDLLRKTVVEAGHDPRNFVLYAFGGAGPSYCAAYSAEVGVREVVVPLGPVASGFSAFGLAASDVVLAQELSDPGQMPVSATATQRHFEELEARLGEALARQNLSFKEIQFVREMDLRYTAQLAEVSVTVPSGDLAEGEMIAAMNDFEAKYAHLFGEGTGFSAAGIQSITLRVQATGVLPFDPQMPGLESASSPDPSNAQSTTRQVCLDAQIGYVDTPIYDYRKLRAGHVVAGPAVIEVETTTVVVPPKMTGTVDHLGNLNIITRD